MLYQRNFAFDTDILPVMKKFCQKWRNFFIPDWDSHSKVDTDPGITLNADPQHCCMVEYCTVGTYSNYQFWYIDVRNYEDYNTNYNTLWLLCIKTTPKREEQKMCQS